MTRKDTIIIAVLINVGLLVVMFTTSLKPSGEPMQASIAQKAPEPAPAPAPIKPPPPPPPKDPIEQMLVKQEQKPAPKPLTPEKPKPAAVESKPDSKNLIPVIVKQGDVLEKLAKQHHTTVEEVMKINRLPNSFLKIGQVLYIPAKSAEKSVTPIAPAKPQEDPVYYVVKNGDNPWTIAVKNHIKVDQLLKLNELDDTSAKKLKPGDRLRIR